MVIERIPVRVPAVALLATLSIPTMHQANTPLDFREDKGEGGSEGVRGRKRDRERLLVASHTPPIRARD